MDVITSYSIHYTKLYEGGIVLATGMAFCYTLIDKIEEAYVTDSVIFVPILFMVLSIPVVVVGFSLLKIKKKRPKKEYF